MKQELIIQLICTDFPGSAFDGRDPIFVGVQKEREIVEVTPGNSAEKVFHIPVLVNTGKNGEPNFSGPYVFGPAGDRFLYLVWFSGDPRLPSQFRRAKIKLDALTWDQIHPAVDNRQPLTAHIKMTDKKGGPVCASLRGEQIRWEG